MFIEQLSTAGSGPALSAMLRFAGQRQRLIAHNIANFDTPNFRPADVSPQRFQDQLASAIDERRARTGGGSGALNLRSTREVGIGEGGELRLAPLTPSRNVMFHDRNNRDLERTMQKLVENASMYRVASELLSSRSNLIGGAIAERV